MFQSEFSKQWSFSSFWHICKVFWTLLVENEMKNLIRLFFQRKTNKSDTIRFCKLKNPDISFYFALRNEYFLDNFKDHWIFKICTPNSDLKSNLYEEFSHQSTESILILWQIWTLTSTNAFKHIYLSLKCIDLVSFK